MSAAIRKVFQENNGGGVFVAFTTVGFPKRESTVEVMLGLERGGADIIELGVPYSDPLADGPTIQVRLAVRNRPLLLTLLFVAGQPCCVAARYQLRGLP